MRAIPLIETRFQNIARADLQQELVIVLFLEQYQRFLVALKQRERIDPTIYLSISKLLLVILSIQHIRLQKYSLYGLMGGNHFRAYLSYQFSQMETELERKLKFILQSMKRNMIHLEPNMLPNTFYFLNELAKYYTKKRKIFPQPATHPSPPWLHPTVNTCSVL